MGDSIYERPMVIVVTPLKVLSSKEWRIFSKWQLLKSASFSKVALLNFVLPQKVAIEKSADPVKVESEKFVLYSSVEKKLASKKSALP